MGSLDLEAMMRTVKGLAEKPDKSPSSLRRQRLERSLSWSSPWAFLVIALLVVLGVALIKLHMPNWPAFWAIIVGTQRSLC